MGLFTKKQFDFIGIGDITNDAFIRVKEANISCDEQNKKCQICLNFADKIAYDHVTVVKGVGNASNASVCAHRLGLSSSIVANVGDDENGLACVETLKNEGVGTEFIKIQKGRETNYNYLILYEEERTILSKHREYDYKLPNIGSPKFVYFSSLGEDTIDYHNEIANYIEKHPEINFVFQPGTFQIKLGYEPLKKIYQLSKLFFCNKMEAKRILETEEDNITELLKMMYNRGPKIVVITDAINGAYSYDGNEVWKIPMYPDPKPPIDRTGAGDAFSATFTSAIALGKTIKEALMWGPINSMSVVQYVGARRGLLTREALEKYLAEAPLFYKPERFL
ncbi:MAG: Sugar kinase, ribokinase family [Parcubacteria group bacterium Athens0714_16]|nr:MAG: Sugar kinase, ribokinase family [Parcubacteria group bacterium Athens0714_16]